MRFKSIIALSVLLVYAFCAFGDQMVERGAKISFFVGKAMAKKGDAKEWKDVKLNQKLSSGDALRTMVESRVDIETSEGTVINIMENTVFEMSELFQNARTKASVTKLNVKTGSILANVKKLTNSRSSFEFETPTATAAIRGTELEIDVLQGRTQLRVKDGTVEFKNKSGGRPAFVFTNQQATAEEGKNGVNVELLKGAKDQKKEGDLALEITSPADGAALTSAVVAFAGKTEPGAVVKINGAQEAAIGSDGSFSGTFSFPEGALGDQALLFTAIKEGRTAVKGVQFTIGAPAPKSVSLAVTEPASNALVTSEIVKVSGTATPGAAIKFGDGQEAASSDGKFSVSYKLPSKEPGNYEIKVTADLSGAVQSVVVPVSIIEPPREMMLILNTPSEGEEFVRKNQIPVEGVTLPGAKVTFGSGASVVADATGMFKGVYEVPKKYGVQELAFTSTLGSKSQKVTVKINLTPGTAGCVVEILDPSAGSEVPVEFEVKGSVDNPDNNAVVTVNGVQAAVTGNAFTAKVNTGFRTEQGERLSLTITSPAAGASLTRLPVIIRGRVTPPLARVFLDGTKEAKVLSDGNFEAEYPMSDETGDYTVEVSAVLETGEIVKKPFDITAASECGGVKSAPVKTTVNVAVGASQTSGETKTSVAFHYEKQKYDLVLMALAPRCLGDKIEIEVRTNAVELRANDKVVPLQGAGGTLRSWKHVIDNTDLGCYAATDVTFAANDEAANPSAKEVTVTLGCPLSNTQKPTLMVVDNGGSKLGITVFDKSFACEKADEEVAVTIEATGEGQIADLTYTRNGQTQLIDKVGGVGVIYTVKAVDKGNNTVIATKTVPAYISNTPRITLINPPGFASTVQVKSNPPYPPGEDRPEGELEFSFRVDNVDGDNPRLLKRVEFRPSMGKVSIFEGASMPTDLTFEPTPVAYSTKDFLRPGVSKTITYTIKVIDITERETVKTGTVTILAK